MNALEIKNLCKSYPGFRLTDLNLTLPSGCVMGLVGENGAGKSTTIKLILDIAHKESGTITVLGKDNQDNFAMTKEDIGVVLDDVGLPDFLTATQIGYIMKNTFRNWDTDFFNKLLRKTAVPLYKNFSELSRGMKMKLGLGIALSHNAKLLILDEPTSGLDPYIRDEIIDILNDFTRDENHSILISSHIVSDLEKLCDYFAFIHRGKLILCEEKDTLLERYVIAHCSAEEYAKISAAVEGKKETPYGTEALIQRSKVPEGIKTSPVDIEELFIYMIRGTK